MNPAHQVWWAGFISNTGICPGADDFIPSAKVKSEPNSQHGDISIIIQGYNRDEFPSSFFSFLFYYL